MGRSASLCRGNSGNSPSRQSLKVSQTIKSDGAVALNELPDDVRLPFVSVELAPGAEVVEEKMSFVGGVLPQMSPLFTCLGGPQLLR